MGGAAGIGMREAIRFGVARGLFSNEAGMGSTPHAHATADVKHPVQQGMTAFVGVFIDTILVCTATALIILLTDANLSGEQGAAVTQFAFNKAFPGFGSQLLAVCLTFFAFTTIIGWYYFGESNIRFLFREDTWASIAHWFCLLSFWVRSAKSIWFGICPICSTALWLSPT